MTATADNPPTRKPRWSVPTPAKFLLAVLVMQGVLFLSAQYRWFWFNERKGWTVLIAVVATTISLLLLAAAVSVSRLSKLTSQFSLATLLCMVAVVGVPCAWLAKDLETARRQQLIFGSLSPHYGGVGYAPENFNDPLARWLEPSLGRHFFHDINVLELKQRNPDALREVRTLTKLTLFRQLGGELTDDDLAYIAECPQIRHLEFENVPIGDAAMKHLSGLEDMETLSLKGTRVTSGGLDHLKNLTQLSVLNLDGTKVDDSGLSQIKNLTRLRHLSLNETQVTDAGLTHLKQLPLVDLCLNGTQISDSGLARVAHLTELRVLYLNNTKVTDAGLKENLEGLKSLQYLILRNNNLSFESVETIQKSLPPLCKIFW